MRGVLSLLAVLAAAPLAPPARTAGAQRAIAIGVVDFYGLHHLSQGDVQRALGIAAGDTVVADSLAPALRRLRAIPGVTDAALAPVCCEPDGRWALFVGIEERGAPRLALDPAPQGAVRLPDDVVQLGRAFDDSLMAAVRRGEAAEHDSGGHAFFDAPALTAIQHRFLAVAAASLPMLVDVLHHSSDAEHRALAAELLGYAPDVSQVIPDLVAAMHDPDSDVRNNAMRALAVIAGYAQQHPELGIRVPTRPFIEMLESVVWTDRNKASFALWQLTASRDSSLLAGLRARALPALLDMARWQSVGHAYAGYMILGRIEGVSDDALQRDWQRGDRRGVIDAAVRMAASDSSR